MGAISGNTLPQMMMLQLRKSWSFFFGEPGVLQVEPSGGSELWTMRSPDDDGNNYPRGRFCLSELTSSSAFWNSDRAFNTDEHISLMDFYVRLGENMRFARLRLPN